MAFSGEIAIFWFRRDLRLTDNRGLFESLTSGKKVLPIFIFDTTILKKLAYDDKRVSFIYQAISELNKKLLRFESSIEIFHGKPLDIFEKLALTHNLTTVFVNHDYEPYARVRDAEIEKTLEKRGIGFKTFKDQVIFEKGEILKADGKPYTVFTPYSKTWLAQYIRQADIKHYPSEDYLSNLVKNRNTENFSLQLIGFKETSGMFTPPMINEEKLQTYAATRDFPASDSTSRLSVHLRFGTISVRQVVKKAMQLSKTWLNELIWREFFMQILWNFPTVEKEAFNAKYKYINWLNREEDFIRWTKGETGYALVDAGMHELNETGFMHNRVRMVTAGFLVKHLLVNWQWGEAYFAEKLLDFELSSNNGNWQWAAGTGCDAAPYFRIFNPENQAVKYDAEHQYIRKWIPGYKPEKYIPKIVDHTFARWRCLETYRKSSNSQ